MKIYIFLLYISFNTPQSNINSSVTKHFLLFLSHSLSEYWHISL